MLLLLLQRGLAGSLAAFIYLEKIKQIKKEVFYFLINYLDINRLMELLIN